MSSDEEMQVKSDNAQESEATRGSNNVKKEEQVKMEEGGEDSSDEDNKPIGLKRKVKPAVKKASVKKEESKTVVNVKKDKKEQDAADKKGMKKVVEEVKVKRTVTKEKKVYDLPGQKRDPPEERDPSRIFYETLYQQVPTSEMAKIWMMECGLLPENVAKQVFEKKQKKAQTLRSPAKTPTSSSKNTSTKSVTVKKEVSSTTTTTKSDTVRKEQPSSADTMKKKKTPDTKISSKPTKKRKTADGSDEDGSDDDFEVISQPKKRKLAG